ncbi:MAG TPA: DUF4911 domain-containing protein [Desulfobacteraceae bacterium]|nr:DUF4911 domain-containing protein [Desulfobacteraceae bacterium]
MTDEIHMKTVEKKYKVEKSRIGFLKFIFEAHDGIAVITTLDAKTGLVRFAIAPDCTGEVAEVIEDLKKDIQIDEA